MYRSRYFLALIGLAVAVAVAGGALAASMLLDGSSEGAALETPGEPEASPLLADGDAGLSSPQGLGEALRQLPEGLRRQILVRLDEGLIDLNDARELVEEYTFRSQAMRLGAVLEATDSYLRLQLHATGEPAEVALTPNTQLRRGPVSISGAELEPGEMVLVLSRDGGETAYSVLAFGTATP